MSIELAVKLGTPLQSREGLDRLARRREIGELALAFER